MGASLVIRTHAWVPRPQVEAWIQQRTSEDAYENGNSYSGYWNMKSGRTHFDESKVFSSVQAAEDHISATNDKFGGLTAVPALVQLEPPETLTKEDGKLKELSALIKEVQQALWQFDAGIVQRAKAGKSAFKGCSHCESRIAVKHLSHTACPVCRGNLLRTETDAKREASLKVKAEKLSTAIRERKEALAKKHFKSTDTTTKVWVVGGWCAS